MLFVLILFNMWFGSISLQTVPLFYWYMYWQASLAHCKLHNTHFVNWTEMILCMQSPTQSSSTPCNSVNQQQTSTLLNHTLFFLRCMKCRRGLVMRILSVRLSVCPSVTCVNYDKTVKTFVQMFIPYKRSFSLVFWEEEWLVGGDPFYLKFWVNRPLLEQIRRFSTDIRP